MGSFPLWTAVIRYKNKSRGLHSGTLSLAKLFCRVNGNLLALFTHTLKLDAAVNQSKQGIVCLLYTSDAADD